jgi:hypothetical protein
MAAVMTGIGNSGQVLTSFPGRLRGFGPSAALQRSPGPGDNPRQAGQQAGESVLLDIRYLSKAGDTRPPSQYFGTQESTSSPSWIAGSGKRR